MNELLEREEIEFILDLYRPNTANEQSPASALKISKASTKHAMQARA